MLRTWYTSNLDPDCSISVANMVAGWLVICYLAKTPWTLTTKYNAAHYAKEQINQSQSSLSSPLCHPFPIIAKAQVDLQLKLR